MCVSSAWVYGPGGDVGNSKGCWMWVTGMVLGGASVFEVEGAGGAFFFSQLMESGEGGYNRWVRKMGITKWTGALVAGNAG